MESQYRNEIDDTYVNAISNQIRWKKTLEFLAKDSDVKSGLDLGDRTPFTGELESFFGCEFSNTDIDMILGDERNNDSIEDIRFSEIGHDIFGDLDEKVWDWLERLQCANDGDDINGLVIPSLYSGESTFRNTKARVMWWLDNYKKFSS